MRKEKYRRYKYFSPDHVIDWSRFRAAYILAQAYGYLSIVHCPHMQHWEINVPVVVTDTEKVEYQALRHLMDAPRSRYLCYQLFVLRPDTKYPFANFRDAFMAAKELRQFYADLPIGVRSEENQEESVIIGRMEADEVAAILTYS